MKSPQRGASAPKPLFTQSTGRTGISLETEYKEANLAHRHFSNMRFLLVSLYMGISGAMFVGTDKLDKSQVFFFIVPFFVSFLALIFCKLEGLLNEYIDKLVDHARRLTPHSYLHQRPRADKPKFVTRKFIALYISVAVIWWFYATAVAGPNAMLMLRKLCL